MLPVLIFTESPADADIARSLVGVQICALSRCSLGVDRACCTTFVRAALSVLVSRLLNIGLGSPKDESAVCGCDGLATLAGGKGLVSPLALMFVRVADELCAAPL